MPKFKAVIFDFDGTLVDTLKDIADSMNQVLTDNGLTAIPLDNYRKLVGSGIDELVRKCLPDEMLNDDQLLKKLTDDFRKQYAVSWDSHCRLFFGIKELLDQLELKEIPKAIFSSKDEFFLNKFVQKLLAKWEFKLVAGRGERFPPKPDPKAVNYFLKSRGLKAENSVYIGDSGLDMQTALNAGCFPVGALWGYRDEQELKSSGAKLLIKNPYELSNYF